MRVLASLHLQKTKVAQGFGPRRKGCASSQSDHPDRQIKPALFGQLLPNTGPWITRALAGHAVPNQSVLSDLAGACLDHLPEVTTAPIALDIEKVEAAALKVYIDERIPILKNQFAQAPALTQDLHRLLALTDVARDESQRLRVISHLGLQNVPQVHQSLIFCARARILTIREQLLNDVPIKKSYPSGTFLTAMEKLQEKLQPTFALAQAWKVLPKGLEKKQSPWNALGVCGLGVAPLGTFMIVAFNNNIDLTFRFFAMPCFAVSALFFSVSAYFGFKISRLKRNFYQKHGHFKKAYWGEVDKLKSIVNLQTQVLKMHAFIKAEVPAHLIPYSEKELFFSQCLRRLWRFHRDIQKNPKALKRAGQIHLEIFQDVQRLKDYQEVLLTLIKTTGLQDKAKSAGL